MITFESVTKQYPSGHTALNDLTFNIDAGEFVFLLGPSGSGKTTILRLMLREITPTKGKILIADHDLNLIPNKEIPYLRRQIGSAFQDFKLLPDKSAYENVALALDILGKGQTHTQKLTYALLDRVGLKEKIHLYPSQLSGGEIQRVAIARALATNPVLLFADEPTGNLDQEASAKIIELLQLINAEGTTVIMSTHDQNLADKFKHRQLHISQGQLVKDTKKGKAHSETKTKSSTKKKVTKKKK